MKKWSIFSVVFLVIAFIVIIIGLTQTKPTITKTAELVLNIKPKPDYTLGLNVPELDSFIARTASFVAEVVSVNEFAGDITISVTGVPSGVIVEILPSDTFTIGAGQTKGVQFNLTIPDDSTLVGTYTLIVAASSSVYN